MESDNTTGGGGDARRNSSVSLYALRRDTWKTGWILRVVGRSSLYAVEEMTAEMVYGPKYLEVSFLGGLNLSTGLLICIVEKSTLFSILKIR